MIARIHNKREGQILLSYLYTLIKPFIPKVFSIIRPSCFERKMWEMRVILQCAPPQWTEILSEGACFYRPNLDHSIQQLYKSKVIVETIYFNLNKEYLVSAETTHGNTVYTRWLRNKNSPSEKISTHCVFIAARIDSKKRPENITLHLYYLLITTENCGRNF